MEDPLCPLLLHMGPLLALQLRRHALLRTVGTVATMAGQAVTSSSDTCAGFIPSNRGLLCTKTKSEWLNDGRRGCTRGIRSVNQIVLQGMDKRFEISVS